MMQWGATNSLSDTRWLCPLLCFTVTVSTKVFILESRHVFLLFYGFIIVMEPVDVNHSPFIKCQLTHLGSATCSGATHSRNAYQQRRVRAHT